MYNSILRRIEDSLSNIITCYTLDHNTYYAHTARTILLRDEHLLFCDIIYFHLCVIIRGKNGD